MKVCRFVCLCGTRYPRSISKLVLLLSQTYFSFPVPLSSLFPCVLSFLPSPSHCPCILLFPTSGVWEYIQSTRDLVCDLEKHVRQAKSNVDTMCNMMAGWCASPLYTRKEDKKDCLLNLEVHAHSTYSPDTTFVHMILDNVFSVFDCLLFLPIMHVAHTHCEGITTFVCMMLDHPCCSFV